MWKKEKEKENSEIWFHTKLCLCREGLPGKWESCAFPSATNGQLFESHTFEYRIPHLFFFLSLWYAKLTFLFICPLQGSRSGPGMVVTLRPIRREVVPCTSDMRQVHPENFLFRYKGDTTNTKNYVIIKTKRFERICLIDPVHDIMTYINELMIFNKLSLEWHKASSSCNHLENDWSPIRFQILTTFSSQKHQTSSNFLF